MAGALVLTLGLVGSSSAAAGKAWSNAQLIPGLTQLSNGKGGHMGAISCSSPGNCTAIGQFLINQPSGGNEENALFGVTEVNGKWGKTLRIPGQTVPSTVMSGSISCSSPGNCGAVASSIPTSDNGAWVALAFNETKGVWGSVVAIPGPSSLMTNSEALAISCNSTGTCSASGYSSIPGPGNSGSIDSAFVATEQNGVWNNASDIQGFPTIPSQLLGLDSGAEADTISCASPENCSAGGWFSLQNGSGSSFVVNEVNGVWGNEITLTGVTTFTDGGGSQVTAVSCSSPGNCSAGGSYAGVNGSQGSSGVFVANEVGGVWGSANGVAGATVTNSAPTLSSMSCSSPGNCSAGGTYGYAPGLFLVNEANGTWGSAIPVPGLAKLGASKFIADLDTVSQVSCSSNGNCGAVGTYTNSSNEEKAFVVTESNNAWGNAITVPGVNALGAISSGASISCVGSGICVAVGVSQNSNSTATQVFATSYGAASTVKKVTITCTKGKLKKKVTAVKPVCPSGYKLSRLY